MGRFSPPPLLYGLDFESPTYQYRDGTPRLLRIGIELSRRCNLRCVYCYANAGERLPEELSLSEILDVLNQASEMGVRTAVIVGGGEPLLYDALPEILRHTSDLGMKTVMFTNAIGMDRTSARNLFDLRVSVIAKLNTLDSEKQDLLAGGINGSFEVMMKGIENLLSVGYGNTSPIMMGIHTVICSLNYNDIPNLWRWIRQHNLFPYFETLKNQGRAADKRLAVSREALHTLFNCLLEIDEHEFGYSWVPHPPLVGWSCQQHFYSCYVTSQGDVQPCSGLPITVGNVRTERLQDIVRKDLFLRLRDMPKNINKQCANCDLHKTCYGCRASAYELCGDPFAPDPNCWLTTGDD
ncbi:MAG: radical SAM protein [Planctomycetota bacterium]|nr:radical SAM protein [Planctomycetota bacterium]